MELEATLTERRRQTRNSIYRHLYHATDFCAKQTLAHALALSMPTVYQNLSELMEAGLVEYSGEQQFTGGRRAMGLSIVADARVAVGVSITDKRMRFVAADLRLRELAYKKLYHAPATELSGLGELLARELELFLDEAHIEREKLLGVGIALPGLIAKDNSRITLSPTLQMKDISLQGLTAHIPYPTYIENDGTSGGYAEWFARGTTDNMAYLSLENGVGGAVMIGGSLYAGDNRRSGEFGHMCVEPGGLRCQCGKQGCLEAYCSAHRISDDLGIRLTDFFAGLEAHNRQYELLWDDWLKHLAIAIGNIRMALDCDIVLGGFMSQYAAMYMPILREYTAANNPFEADAEYLHLCKLPKHTVPLGVALHFIAEFIDSI